MPEGSHPPPSSGITSCGELDDRVTSSLTKFPPEIFLKIIELLDTARDVSSLSRTCKIFRELNERHGWQLFVHTKFPSLSPSSLQSNEKFSLMWRDIAQCLTTQSRAWDRRAISAITLSFADVISQPRRYQTSRQSGSSQSNNSSPNVQHFYCWDPLSTSLSRCRVTEDPIMDETVLGSLPPPERIRDSPFHPVIASTMEFSGQASSNKQIIAYCTGPEVFVRVRTSGSLIPPRLDKSHMAGRVLDEYSDMNDWFSVQNVQFQPGHHDVTSINIMEPGTQPRPFSPAGLVVDLIVGRTSGHLHRYRVSDEGPIRAVVNTFHSLERNGVFSRRSVRSADVNSDARNQLLVACSDRVLSLYNTASETHDVLPSTEFDIELELSISQARTVKFSSPENVVLGLRKSAQPIHTYRATPTGLVLTEKFGLLCQERSLEPGSGNVSGSVFAIEPLSVASRAGGSLNGDVFLSGWNDGACHIFDLRTGHTPVSSFYDSVDNASAIYSLAAFGQERFLAGSSSSVLKIFDFRNGAKPYQYSNGLPCSANSPSPGVSAYSPSKSNGQTGLQGRCRRDDRGNLVQTCHFHETSKIPYRPNASFYLYGVPKPPHHSSTRRHKSPIFSLSSPSPLCPFVYAGTTGTIFELEVSEFSNTGAYMDPTIVAVEGASFNKKFEELVMYESQCASSADELHDTPDTLWTQLRGRRVINENSSRNSRRLDCRWHVV